MEDGKGEPRLKDVAKHMKMDLRKIKDDREEIFSRGNEYSIPYIKNNNDISNYIIEKKIQYIHKVMFIPSLDLDIGGMKEQTLRVNML